MDAGRSDKSILWPEKKKEKKVYSTKGEIEWENAVSRRTIRFSIEAKYTILLTKKIKCQF